MRRCSCTRADIPLQPVKKTMMEQVFSAACGEDHAKADVCALKEAAVCGEPVLQQVLLTGTVAWGGTHSAAG